MTKKAYIQLVTIQADPGDPDTYKKFGKKLHSLTKLATQDQLDGTPRFWLQGTRKTKVREFACHANVNNGTVTFWLTDTGAQGGNAIFENIYQDTIRLAIFDLNNVFNAGNVQIAQNKKSITVTVNKLILALGLLSFVAAANGVTVYLNVKGD